MKKISHAILVIASIVLISCVHANSSTGMSIPTISRLPPQSSVIYSNAFREFSFTGDWHSPTNPKEMVDFSDRTSFLLPYTGLYYYHVQINWYVNTDTRKTAFPLHGWTDAWATSKDAYGNVKEIRVLYSGDSPLVLNFAFGSGPGPTDNKKNAYEYHMYGQVYLNKGSTLYLPRFWTLGTPSDVTTKVNGSYDITFMRS